MASIKKSLHLLRMQVLQPLTFPFSGLALLKFEVVPDITSLLQPLFALAGRDRISKTK